MLARGPAGMYRRDIGRELRLLKGSFQNIAMRNSDFSPGVHGLFPLTIEQRGLLRARRSCRCGFDGAPACNDLVVGTGIFSPARTLAQSIQPVGDLAGGFGFAL